MATELRKVGAEVEEGEDYIVINCIKRRRDNVVRIILTLFFILNIYIE